MNAKLFFATLVAVCAVSLAFDKMPTINDNFMKEEVCGEKGAQTLGALEGDCAKEMDKLVKKREEICQIYTEGGLEKAQEEIGKCVKEMSDQEKKDLGKCLGEAYKKAHGKPYEDKA